MKRKRILTLVGSICLTLVLAALLLPACAETRSIPEKLTPAPTPPPAPTPAPAPKEPTRIQEEANETEAQVIEAYEFTENLVRGARGEEVVELQYLLSLFPDVYPEGLVTGYFDSLTEGAVKKFQEKYAEEILGPQGLSEGTGFVGPTTRAKLNELARESIPVVSDAPATPVAPAAIEENKKSPVFLRLAEKIGEDDAECLVEWVDDFDSIMTEEFIDEFIIDHSPGYDADNDVTIIGDPEAPYFLEIAENSLDRLYGYSPELYQYATEELRYIRGINFGTRCGSARTGGPWMERNIYNNIYDYKDTPWDEQPPIYGTLFIHEATHVKNHELERSGQIRKLTGYENEAIAYLAHAYYAKEYDPEGQRILEPIFGMTLKEFVMRWVFRCIEEPEDYVWDWDFYVTVLEKAGFPPEELEKLKAYLAITSTAPVISNIQISNFTPDSVTISWDTDKLAKSKLEYSPNSDLSSATTISDDVYGTTHPPKQLVNLSQGKTYYYKITVTDVSHNSSVSSIRQFVK
ncbi:hypothetical protein ES706_04431 [subsurface metagenome]